MLSPEQEKAEMEKLRKYRRAEIDKKDGLSPMEQIGLKSKENPNGITQAEHE